MMYTAPLLKRILRGDDAKIAISTLLAWQQCNCTGGEKTVPRVTVMYIPKEVLDDVEEFGRDDCLMHDDNELCDTALVINIVDVLKTIRFKK